MTVFRIGDSKRAIVWMFLTAMLCAVSNAVPAARDPFGSESNTFDFDESKVEKWQESAVAIPLFPADADLIAVPPAPSVSLKLYIDAKSLSRAEDRTVRFTLIVETSSGARNVLYEGIRCETRQYKTYAIGSAEHSFTAVKDAAWRTIPRAEANAFRDYLYKNFVCDEQRSARTPNEVRQLLRYLH